MWDRIVSVSLRPRMPKVTPSTLLLALTNFTMEMMTLTRSNFVFVYKINHKLALICSLFSMQPNLDQLGLELV